ncbi:cupin 2 domain-containing protein [Mariprofundus ferrinatatus]|uniref:Cupin 2 domain-containing protein n=1 Tax=Mariprofundus ferrinatatus TaxID=1921087 RepID=A0A2K8L1P6_9PROT|nr:cupin domain-containing protein [Mariprofundus ferrinatatus]ATX81207.1 cupin 2 domain-containing protein [Mariprofundus ferrinatatus]
MKQGNILSTIPADLPEELSELLVHNSNLRIERIVSRGHRSDEGFWYDQDEDEWVLLLHGSARLQFEDKVLTISAGDHILIPAHTRHRVCWTDPDVESIWLAIFSKEPLR